MNRVCEIPSIQYPVIQGPMAWITSSELVAAVSNLPRIELSSLATLQFAFSHLNTA